MPPGRRKQLKRFEHPNHARFVTFSTYQRLPLLSNDRIKQCFVDHLQGAKQRFGFHLYAWVVMPEHVHLLMWPRVEEAPLSVVLRDLKREFAREVLGRWRELNAPVLPRLIAPDGSTRFWQRGGGYDRNVYSEEEFFEKANYIHNNPVTRGLVTRADEWRWSSASRSRECGWLVDPLPARKPE